MSILRWKENCVGALRRPLSPMFVLICFLTFGWFFANFERPFLGCIEADFCKWIVNTRLKALGDIYKVYKLLHRSECNNSARIRQTSSHVCSLIVEKSLNLASVVQNSENFTHWILMKNRTFSIFLILRKRSKYPIFSNFLRFRIISERKLLNYFSETIFRKVDSKGWKK